MEVVITVVFIRYYKKLPPSLQAEVAEKIELFRDEANHKQLKVHKLKGSLKEQLSFSVNYRYRIIFYLDPKNKNRAYLLTVGDHKIYE